MTPTTFARTASTNRNGNGHDDQQGKAENLTSHSPYCRQKSGSGIHRQHQGNDRERSLPEDKRYEEMGPTARVWRTYLEECAPFDLEMVEGWRNGLDVLLVFAGVFSVVVTIFVAQTSQSLRVDYGQVTASLLIELIEVQRSTANGSVVNDIPRSDLTFRSSTLNAWVNGLWFTSLSLSLATALFVVLTKQWIHQYMSVSSGTPRDRCRLRQFRYMGLQKWGVDLIIGFLPIPMSVSLAVFMVGLVLFIIPLQISTASVVGAITFASFAAYLITSFLSVLYPSCPYKTPLSQYMFFLYTHIMDSAAFFNRAIFKDYSPTASTKPASRPLKHAEIAAVERYADEMDVYALSWLYSMSSNPSVQSIVVQSTSALPLKSVESLSYQIPDLPGICHSALSDLLSEPYENHQGQIDRFTRASLRFPESSFSVGVDDSMQGCLSQEVSAQLLCFHDTGREKIRKLLLSNSSAEGIALQPIVWARLLCRLLPFGPDDRDVAHYLLQAIPSSYWQAEFVCPPLVFEQQGMSIFNNTGSEAVSLQATIDNHLYPWVGENIIRGSLNITDSIFNPDEYPSSQDPRLRFLLTLAGSPSIQCAPSGNIFRQTISMIETFCGIDSSSDWMVVMVELTSHRYAVLKLFHTLLSSGTLGKDSRHRHAALLLFLSIVESTFPLPPFICQDSGLAAEVVRLTFEDGAWAAFDHPSNPVYALVRRLFHFPPVVNEAFKYAASERLFDRVLEVLRYHPDDFYDRLYYPLCTVQTFITGLASSRLDPQVSQRFLGYLHEPDVLFAVCAALVARGLSGTLRDLARLFPDDPAWPVCLQRLRDYAYPAWLSDHHNIPGILADLIAVLEGDDPFGRTSSSTVERIAQRDDNSLKNMVPGAPRF